jgi:hypothetical protein
MKITKGQLRQIIKEELQVLSQEALIEGDYRRRRSLSKSRAKIPISETKSVNEESEWKLHIKYAPKAKTPEGRELPKGVSPEVVKMVSGTTKEQEYILHQLKKDWNSDDRDRQRAFWDWRQDVLLDLSTDPEYQGVTRSDCKEWGKTIGLDLSDKDCDHILKNVNNVDWSRFGKSWYGIDNLKIKVAG